MESNSGKISSTTTTTTTTMITANNNINNINNNNIKPSVDLFSPKIDTNFNGNTSSNNNKLQSIGTEYHPPPPPPHHHHNQYLLHHSHRLPTSASIIRNDEIINHNMINSNNSTVHMHRTKKSTIIRKILRTQKMFLDLFNKYQCEVRSFQATVESRFKRLNLIEERLTHLAQTLHTNTNTYVVKRQQAQHMLAMSKLASLLQCNGSNSNSNNNNNNNNINSSDSTYGNNNNNNNNNNNIIFYQFPADSEADAIADYDDEDDVMDEDENIDDDNNQATNCSYLEPIIDIHVNDEDDDDDNDNNEIGDNNNNNNNIDDDDDVDDDDDDDEDDNDNDNENENDNDNRQNRNSNNEDKTKKLLSKQITSSSANVGFFANTVHNLSATSDIENLNYSKGKLINENNNNNNSNNNTKISVPGTLNARRPTVAVSSKTQFMQLVERHKVSNTLILEKVSENVSALRVRGDDSTAAVLGYQCSVNGCTYMHFLRAQVNRHYKNFHSKTCSHCNQRFKRPIDLLIHLNDQQKLKNAAAAAAAAEQCGENDKKQEIEEIESG